MPRSTWLNLLIILLVIIAASFVAQQLFQFLSGFSDIILLVVLAWLVAYALNPLIEGLDDTPLPPFLVKFDPRLEPIRISRVGAVAIVYVSLVILLVIIMASLIPALLSQVNAIAAQLTQVDTLERALANTLQGIAEVFNLSGSLDPILGNLFSSLQSFATPVLQNMVTILTSIISLVGNIILVLLLSFFFALDGPKFTESLFDAMPPRVHQETRMFMITSDRAFGGFLRAQLVQAALVGIGTAVVMALFGIQAALVSSFFAGLFMLIPLVGPLLSLIPPLLSTLMTDPGKILLVLLPLIIFQAVLVNAVMPRIMGNALGLHPLVIIVSLLIGIKVGGFWGAFFAMPLAGILSAFGSFLIRRRQRLQELTEAIIQEDTEPSPTTPLDTSGLLREPRPPTAVSPQVEMK